MGVRTRTSGIIVAINVEPTPSGAATSWNPADYTGNGNTVTFSSSNRVWTRDAGGNTNLEGRSVTATVSNQKVYIEHTITAVTFSVLVGFAGNEALANNLSFHSNTSPTGGWMIFSSIGNFSCFDSADHGLAMIPACVAGDTIDLAFNTQTLKCWARKNNGAWNASGTGGDPAAGTNGYTAAVTGAPPFFAAYGADSAAADQLTTRFAQSDWVNTAPAGFTQLAA